MKKKTASEIRFAEITRLEKIPYAQTPKKGIDSGAYGKALELELTPCHSRKTCVAGHNTADNYCYIDGKREPIEIKSNGGRIGQLFKIVNPTEQFIAYKLHICNSTTKGKLIDIPTKIMTVSRFLEILQTAGAIRKNSRDNEPCIQPSKRTLWKLMENELDYNPERRYSRKEIR